LKSLKEAVGKMQDSVYVEPVPVKNAITDLKGGQDEDVVGEPTVHMHARDGFGERPAPMPKLPPAPKELPKLPMAPPRPGEKPKPPAPQPPQHFQESPLAPTVVMTSHAKSATPPPVPPKLNPIEENAKKFEQVMHQNVVSMHAALRESTRETQEQLASQLAAKKRAEEAKLAREMQTAEEKRKKIEQKEKAAALRKEEQEKAEAERNYAHQQVLDYRAAQKKARELKELQKMEKKKEAERLTREKMAKEEAEREKQELSKEKHEDTEQTPEITDTVDSSTSFRASQFVSSPSMQSKPFKEAKGSALTNTLSLSLVLAILCYWW